MSTIPRREPGTGSGPEIDPLCDQVERLERILAICEQFDDAWLAGGAPKIEDFLGRVEPELKGELLGELLGLEVSNLIDDGQDPRPESYLGRFPGFSSEVEALFRASARPGPAPARPLPVAPAAPLETPRPFQLGDDEPATEVLVRKDATPFPMPAPRGSRSTSLRAASRTGPMPDELEPRSRYKHIRTRETGGMGRISQVYDRVLRRFVAIKEIKPEFARDTLARQRFLREARITGALNHPSVVPIHSVEAYSDGTPYYVMRWVDGREFREVIKAYHDARAAAPGRARAMGRNSREFRRLLGQFVEICNVVQSAHDQGVMHRDIKPVNIMIGRHGEVVVLDWGLARFIDPAREREAAAGEAQAAGAKAAAAEPPARPPLDAGALGVHPELTTAGDFHGTRGYASPEHYGPDPDGLDARSDVYSLGVTLYVLLTDRNPFRVEEKSTDEQIREKVLAGDFPRPSALVKGIHRELEAICLKALATDPAARYQSVRELAEDVENWLADQPVSARKVRPLAWAGRLARHHSKAVVVAGSILLAITGGLVFGNYTITDARDRLRHEHLAVLTANDKMLHSVTQGRLALAPGAEELRRDIAKLLVDSYQAILKASPDQDDVREKLAYASSVLANIHRQLGDHDRASTLFNDSIRHRLKVIERKGRGEKPASELIATVVDAYNNVYFGQGAERAREGWTRLRTELAWAMESAKSPVVLARVSNVEAAISAGRGQLDDAIRLQRQAIAAVETMLATTTDDTMFGMVSLDLSLYHLNLGAQLDAAGRPDEAEAAFRDARRVLHDKRARKNRELDGNFLIPEGRCAQAYARMLRKIPARRADALRELEAAHAAFDRLARDFPASMGLSRYAIDAALELARCLNEGKADDHKRAVELCESAVRLAREVAGDSLEGSRISPLVISLVELDEALDRTLGFEKNPHQPMAEAQELMHKARDAQGSDVSRNPALIRFNRSGARFDGPRDGRPPGSAVPGRMRNG